MNSEKMNLYETNQNSQPEIKNTNSIRKLMILNKEI